MKQERWLSLEWQQRALNALKDTLDISQDYKRQMIQFLFDEGFWDENKLSWDGALSRYSGCLNPDRPECFRNVEIWALMKRFRRYAWLQAMADDLGFELHPVPSEERRQALLVRLTEGVERSNAVLAEAMDLLKQGDGGRSVTIHRAIREGEASFAIDPPVSL